MPQNGQINKRFGTYKSVCCGAEIVINPGEPFPDCPSHLKLPTIWKPVGQEKIVIPARNKPDLNPFVEVHIDNRRLFSVAAGTVSLEAWERDHLHICNVCQGVLYVFLKQPIAGSSENRERPEDAA